MSYYYDESAFRTDEQQWLEDQTDVNEPSITDPHSVFEGFYRRKNYEPVSVPWEE